MKKHLTKDKMYGIRARVLIFNGVKKTWETYLYIG